METVKWLWYIEERHFQFGRCVDADNMDVFDTWKCVVTFTTDTAYKWGGYDNIRKSFKSTNVVVTLTEIHIVVSFNWPKDRMSWNKNNN